MRPVILNLLHLLIFYSVCIQINAQVDQEFWFVAPDTWEENGDSPVFLRVSAYDKGANVTVSLPADNNRILKSFKVAANSQYSFEIDKSEIENTPSNSVNDFGLYIKSDADITVYYDISNPNNSEKFILKGNNALGNEFFVPSQNIYQNYRDFGGKANEKADIVATEDNTTIEIIPSINITGHLANDTFQITLNKGQTFCIECSDISNSASLAGTQITADKRIAVTISDDAIVEDLDSDPNDLIGDQLVPVSVLGTEYVAINTSKSPDSFKNTNTVQKVFVLAIEDNTMVFLNNTTKNTKSLQKGEIAEFDISDHSIFIYATKKVYAYQVTGLVNTTTSSANELSSGILPGYNCNGSDKVSFTRIFNRDFWLSIVVKRKDIKSFIIYDNLGNELNFKKYIKSWQTVPGQDTGMDSWVCTTVNMDDITTGSPYFIENTSGLFHLCVLDENGSESESGSTSFGYFSSYNSLWIEGLEQECVGNAIQLTANEGMLNYNWFSVETGNTVLSTDRIFSVTKSGTYYLESEVKTGGCTLGDSMVVEFQLPEVDLGNDTILCGSAELTYTLPDTYSEYEWSNGDMDHQTNVSADEVGDISLGVTVTDEIGCVNQDTVNITIANIPTINLDKTEVCLGTSVVNTTDFVRYVWVYNGNILNAIATQNWITPQQSGMYTITGQTAEGCSVTENISITVNTLPEFNLEDQSACEGETTIINGPPGYSSYEWSTGETTQNIELDSDTGYWLEITDVNGCHALNSASIIYHKPALLDLGPDKNECIGANILISGDASLDNFSWTFIPSNSPYIESSLSPTPEYAIQIRNADTTHNGIYRAMATDINGCSVQDEVEVNVFEANPPELFLTENLCEGDEVDIIASEGYDTYSWYFDGTPMSASDNLNQLADVSEEGLYRVEATLGACTISSEIQVASHSLPSVQLPEDFTVCEGFPRELTLESFTSNNGSSFGYLYWNDNEDLKYSNWETASLAVFSGGSYSVTAVDAYGCKASDQIEITSFIPEEFDLGQPQSFCSGETILLENPVKGAQDFKWFKLNSSGNTLLAENSSIEINEAGSYRLEVVDTHGCEVSDQVDVNENTLPEINIAGDNISCGETTLYANSADENLTYQWNRTSGLNSKELVADQSGTYSLQVWNNNGCMAEDSMDVIVHTLPSYSLDSQYVCEGENITIAGPEGYVSYLWSTGVTTRDVELSNTPDYWLEVTDVNGCKAKASSSIEFIKPIAINLGEDRDECEGNTIKLKGDQQHTSWVWSFTSSSTLQSTSLNPSVSNEFEISNGTPNDNGIYSVQVQDVNGCLVSDDVRVTFYAAEIPSLLTTKALCEGDSIDIYASEGYDSYKWYLNNQELPANANQSILSDVHEEGVYRVEATLGACVISNEVEVIKHGLPHVQLADNLTICNGVETLLQVEDYQSKGSSLDYLYWNGNDEKRFSDWHHASLRVNEPGRYTVTAMDEFGCESSDYVEVSEFKEPDLLTGDRSVCKNDLLTLNIDEGYSSYEWSNGDRDHETLVKTGNAGLMQLGVTVTNAKGCVISDSIDIMVNDIPSIILDKEETCKGQVITNITDFIKYEWEFKGEKLNTIESQNWITPRVSGIYTITGYTSEGCMVSDNVAVTVHSLPDIHLNEQIACAGSTVQINGPTGFSSYQWSTGETNQHIELNTATDYWVEVTDANGCKGIAEASLSYIQPMNLDLGSDKKECAGVGIRLSGNAAFTNYNWSFEPASNPGASISINPEIAYEYEESNAVESQSGIYRVEARDVNGCPVSDEVSISIYNLAPPELSTEEILCHGTSIEIMATEGYDSYTWYRNGTHLESSDNQVYLTGVSQAGIYRLETTLSSCSSSRQIEVVERSLPTITLSGNSLLCDGEESRITINNYTSPEGTAFEYLYWNDDDILRYSNWQTAALVINTADTYNATVVDINGCSYTDSIVIDNVSPSTLELGNPIQICKNEKVLLDNPESNTQSYQWYQVKGDSEELQITDMPLEVSESGIYRLQIQDVNGCLTQDDISVNVMPLPEIKFTGDIESCVSTALTVNADSYGSTFQWNNNPTLNSNTITVEKSGVYHIDVQDEYGCRNSDSITVTIHGLSDFVLENDTVCAGESGVLSGPEDSGMEYLWSTGQKTASIEASQGSYSLLVTDENGCLLTKEATVVWREVPNVDLGPDVIICPLENWMLDAGSGYTSYAWHNGAKSSNIIANLLDTVNTVVVTDQFGCNGFDSQTVKYKSTPEMELCSDTSVCEYEELVLDPGFGFLSYLWNDGDVVQRKSIDSPGTYWVEVSDGCFMFRDTAQVLLYETPIIAHMDTSMYAQLVVLGEGGTEPYSYMLDDGFPQEENIFKNLKNGEHEVVVEDMNGCMTSTIIQLNNNLEIEVPDFFTPNDDGVNDRWVIAGIERFPDSYIRIFDRYGKLLIKYRASDPGWDGMYLGRNVSTDDYWYVIDRLPFNRSLKGHFTLMRK